MMEKFILNMLFALICIVSLHGQISQDNSLEKLILSKDSLLFIEGFNKCNVAPFEVLLAEDFEFYHDKSGVSDRQKFLTDFKNGLCKSPGEFRSRRELSKGTSFVYPLYTNGVLYGAVQSGSHVFFESYKGQPEKIVGSARFTHTWLFEQGNWRLARSLSFDHHPVADKLLLMDYHDGAVRQWLERIKVPAVAIGVIRQGQLQEVKIYGSSDIGIPAACNTIFNVASLAKPVTAMVVMRLVSSGQWDLDAPLYRYWTDPDVAGDPRSRQLTTRHILSHQSGFTNWRFNNSDKKLRFDFEPGKRYQYSGEGYEYLRRALEKKFKIPFHKLAYNVLFAPLRMEDSDFIWNDRLSNTIATGFDGEQRPYAAVKNTIPNAADDLFTSVFDYGNFLVSLLKRDGLSESIFKQMTGRQVATGKDKYFGLGMEIYDLGGDGYALLHSGADNGARSLWILLPKANDGLVILTNSDNGHLTFEPLIKHYLGAAGAAIISLQQGR